MAEADVCPICAEAANRSDRKPVTCPLPCQPGPAKPWACRACYGRFLLGTPAEPACMFCRLPWTTDFFEAAFTAAFRTGPYRAHRAAVLREQQTALLPAAQPVAAAHQAEAALEARTSAARELLAAARAQLQAAKTRVVEAQTRVERLEQQKAAAVMQARHAVEGMEGVGAAGAQGEAGGAGDRRAFVKKCTVDGCEGYLTTAYKCGMCATWVCPRCHAVKGAHRDAPHACKPEDVASVEAIRAHARPCPKCGVPTEKSFGCSQMWCVACHTAWDWNTRRVDTGRIHNPEYMAWLARTGRRPEEGAPLLPCGAAGLPPVDTLAFYLRALRGTPALAALLAALGGALHVAEVELRHYRARLRPAAPVRAFLDINVHKLRGGFPDDGAWATALERRNRDYEKAQERYDRYQTFVLGATDVFQGLLANIAAAQAVGVGVAGAGGAAAREATTAALAAAVNAALAQLTALRDLVNDSLMRMARRKQCSVRTITPEWELKSWPAGKGKRGKGGKGKQEAGVDMGVAGGAGVAGAI